MRTRRPGPRRSGRLSRKTACRRGMPTHATASFPTIAAWIRPIASISWPGSSNAAVLCGTAPGDMPLILPPGVAKKVPAGSKLVFQMHYTPNGTAYKDRSAVGVIFAKEPPQHEVAAVTVMEPRFRIPPGAENYE